jgi:hypothetical protein
MKLQLSVHGKVITIETPNDDLTIEEYFDNFKGLLVSAGFSEKNIDNYIIYLSNQLNEWKKQSYS